jgi:hypothetical protein
MFFLLRTRVQPLLQRNVVHDCVLCACVSVSALRILRLPSSRHEQCALVNSTRALALTAVSSSVASSLSVMLDVSFSSCAATWARARGTRSCQRSQRATSAMKAMACLDAAQRRPRVVRGGGQEVVHAFLRAQPQKSKAARGHATGRAWYCFAREQSRHTALKRVPEKQKRVSIHKKVPLLVRTRHSKEPGTTLPVASACSMTCLTPCTGRPRKRQPGRGGHPQLTGKPAWR